VNIALGSKGFEEQQAKRKRSEPGTLIRSRNYSNRRGGGERRAIGRIQEASLSICGRVERFDPEGRKKPRRGAEIRVLIEIAESEPGNGFAA